MIRAPKFVRRLAVTWLVVAAALAGTIFLAFRSLNEYAEMNRRLVYTEDVLEELSQARIELNRTRGQEWAYLATRDARGGELAEEAEERLQQNVERVRGLTRDKPKQQAALTALLPLIATRREQLRREMERSSNISAEPAILWAGSSQDAQIFDQIDTLEANERALFSERAEAASANARLTRRALILLGAITALILAGGGYLIRREVMVRVQVEAGLRRAREMLGQRYEEQHSELSHALEDLQAQIFERRRAEEKIQLLNRELEERVKQRTAELEEINRELEAFTYSVSHDLRAPLRHMDGFSRILLEEYSNSLPGDAQHCFERIQMAAQQMHLLVEGLLDLSRIGRQSLRRQPVSLGELAHEVIANLQGELSGRRIEWKLSPLPETEGDPVLLRQVFANLLQNAAKFTRQRSVSVIEIGGKVEEGSAVIFVRDNGVGFDPRFADKLYGVFQRLHRQDEFEGTGVGLATVQRIVHKHGGRVWAESQPDQGATFFFSLPGQPASERAIPIEIGAGA